jgi:hypothetical protein
VPTSNKNRESYYYLMQLSSKKGINNYPYEKETKTDTAEAVRE